MRQNPLAWALPIQAALLFACLNLLDPWGDEWQILTVAPQPLNQLRPIVDHPPLYFLLLHFWIHIPWPSSLLLKIRSMSCLWALMATVIFYCAWLRAEPLRIRWMFLALWVLSPCLLLFARMARSYSMQLALALLTIYAALEWSKRPQSKLWLLAFSGSAGTLLYTHYLPGLAIVMAVGLVVVSKSEHFAPARVIALCAPILVIALFYLPWLTPLRGAIVDWLSSSPYQVGNIFTDQLVRIGYWFVSFSFGETISTPGIVLATVLTPAVLYALYQAVQSRPDWLSLVFAASVVGYIGVSRFNSFPFTPSHMLFVLPFFILLLVKGIDASYRHASLIFAGLLAVYVLADYSYFSKDGFLNKAYCVPYQEMAAVIRNRSPTAGAVLFVGEYGSFSDPLLNRLPRGVQVVPIEDENAVQKEVDALRGRPTVIWFWRRTHDPSGMETRLEKELSQGRMVRQYDYLPYSRPERWILRLVRGPCQPGYFYRLSEMY